MHESSSNSDDPALVSERTMNIVVALGLLVVAAIAMTDSLRLGISWIEAEGPAAGYFPFYLGVILAVASLYNLGRAFLDRSGGIETFVSKPAFRMVLAVLVPLTIYVAAVGVIGIYIASAVYIALFMRFFGTYSLGRGALVGAAVAVALFMMFEVWFLVPLPKGPLEEMLGY